MVSVCLNDEDLTIKFQNKLTYKEFTILTNKILHLSPVAHGGEGRGWGRSEVDGETSPQVCCNIQTNHI